MKSTGRRGSRSTFAMPCWHVADPKRESGQRVYRTMARQSVSWQITRGCIVAGGLRSCQGACPQLEGLNERPRCGLGFGKAADRVTGDIVVAEGCSPSRIMTVAAIS
jgi:hypothetical protein